MLNTHLDCSRYLYFSSDWAADHIDVKCLIDASFHCAVIHAAERWSTSSGLTGGRKAKAVGQQLVTLINHAFACRVMPAGAKMYFSKASATPSLSLLATCRAASMCGCVGKLMSQQSNAELNCQAWLT